MPPASPDQSTKPQGATSLAPRRVGLTDFGDLDMGSEGALCPDSKGNAWYISFQAGRSMQQIHGQMIYWLFTVTFRVVFGFCCSETGLFWKLQVETTLVASSWWLHWLKVVQRDLSLKWLETLFLHACDHNVVWLDSTGKWPGLGDLFQGTYCCIASSKDRHGETESQHHGFTM